MTKRIATSNSFSFPGNPAQAKESLHPRSYALLTIGVSNKDVPDSFASRNEFAFLEISKSMYSYAFFRSIVHVFPQHTSLFFFSLLFVLLCKKTLRVHIGHVNFTNDDDEVLTFSSSSPVEEKPTVILDDVGLLLLPG